jgi:hypothetical protein
LSSGLNPIIWKGISGNFETFLALDSEVKKAHHDVGDVEEISVRMEDKLEEALKNIGRLKQEATQMSMLRSDFQDQRTHVGALEAKRVSVGGRWGLLMQPFKVLAIGILW